MLIQELFEAQQHDKNATFGFESKKNLDKVKRALHDANIDHSHSTVNGIYYIHFNNAADMRKAVKIADKIIDHSKEKEWQTPGYAKVGGYTRHSGKRKFTTLESKLNEAVAHKPSKDVYDAINKLGMKHWKDGQHLGSPHKTAFVAPDANETIHKELHKILQSAGYEYTGVFRKGAGKWHKNYVLTSEKQGRYPSQGKLAQIEHENGMTYVAFF